MKKDNEGLHPHRFESNPMEQAFAEVWNERNKDDALLKYLLLPPDQDQRFPAAVSGESRLTAATIIQWLGSPVGQTFLRDVQQKHVEIQQGTEK